MISAIIDIGSGSVGVALALLEKGKIPTIEYSDRRSLKPERTRDTKKILGHSLEVLSTMVVDMQKSSQLGAPSSIFCFLSPHLIASQTRAISTDFDKPTKISALMITDIINKELLKVSSETPIEQEIMTVKLNGYETVNPTNKIAEHVEVSVFYTVTSESIRKALRDTVTSVFHNEQVKFHSFSFAYFNVLRDLFGADDDFIFMDIGSEITDVALVKQGAIFAQTSFPSGKNDFIGTGVTAQRGADNNIAKRVASWTASLKQAVDTLDPDIRLPDKIYTLADRDVSAIFKQNIGLLYGNSKITEMTNAELSKFCDNRGMVGSDPFLTIATIFINKLLN